MMFSSKFFGGFSPSNTPFSSTIHKANQNKNRSKAFRKARGIGNTIRRLSSSLTDAWEEGRKSFEALAVSVRESSLSVRRRSSTFFSTRPSSATTTERASVPSFLSEPDDAAAAAAADDDDDDDDDIDDTITATVRQPRPSSPLTVPSKFEADAYEIHFDKGLVPKQVSQCGVYEKDIEVVVYDKFRTLERQLSWSA